MSSLRTKGKSTIVWILMGMLLLGLGGFGVTNFSGGTTEIGSVGKTDVDAQSYARALQNQIDEISRQTGQRITIDQARMLGLTQTVQQRLFTAAALTEEARKIGVSVGDRAVADAITAAPAFQGPGGFDRTAYAEVLRREGTTEPQFETNVRADLANTILENGIIGGIYAPDDQVKIFLAWQLEQRDISWQELTAADLPMPVAPADEETLRAWHQANATRFMAPEIRKISYVWLNPDMLSESVDLDEAALRELYDSKSAEYHQPERRLVGRLVFESEEAAKAAKSRIDTGKASFEQIANERGLSLEDTDLGEQTRDQLGEAAETIFSATDNGVVGPVDSELGPALYAVNAILDPIDVSFEEALPDLRTEVAAARARRVIEGQVSTIEDLLASGATLEDLAKETDMQIGQIDWTAASKAEPGEINGYPSFREHAAQVSGSDYPELFQLDDGGVFALRLDEVVKPELIPFDDIREKVVADWTQEETHRQLLALAEGMKLKAVSQTMPPTDPVADEGGQVNGVSASRPAAEAESDAAANISAVKMPAWKTETGLLRDGYLEHAPPNLITDAFKLNEGETEVVASDKRVTLVRVDKIKPAVLDSEAAKELSANLSPQLNNSLQVDVFNYYARALQSENGIELNPSAISAVESRF